MHQKDYIIRLEQTEDYRAVETLVRESFWNVYRPGCSEHYVIHVLRDDPAFVKELDFVMEQDGRLIGQNMFMKTVINADDGRVIDVLTMGPIGIAPAVIGNAVIWCIYTLWNRKHPQGQRKTLREELQAGMEREAKRRKTPDDRSKPEQPSEQNRENAPEEAAYPPENQSKLEQEAMLFYSENSDSDES